jgi:Ribonuclease G/E
MGAVDRLILTGGPGERRLALLSGDAIVDLLIDRFTPRAGDLYLGRVLARPQGLAAAFVEIGDEQPAFLGQSTKAQEGDTLLVQVQTAARRHKGASVSARPTLPGQWLAYDPFRPGVTCSRRVDGEGRDRLRAVLLPLLQEGEGVVARSQAPGASPEELTAELAHLRLRWAALEARMATLKPPARIHAPTTLERVLQQNPGIETVEVDQSALLAEARDAFPAARLVPGCWENSGAAETLEQSLERRVKLPGGGALVIDETEALTVIDIDGGAQKPADANRAALPEIARQMRLRGLAGHILIDIIPPCSKPEMTALLRTLEKLLADDPTASQVIGATRLGLIELTRERCRPSLSELFLADPGPVRDVRTVGLEALAAAIRAVEHDPALHPLLTAAPPVIHWLQSQPDLLTETQTRLGRPLALAAKDGMAGITLTESRI